MKAHVILSVLVLALGAAASSTAEAQSSTEARFVGADGNWFDARNWSTGRVPGAANDVVLPAGAQVVIDPARGSADVAVRDLTIDGGASLTTLPGTVVHTRDEHVALGGHLVHKGSGSEGGNLVFDPNPACTGDPFGCAVGPLSGWTLNPTPKQKRIVVLQSSVTTQIGLGGTTPASLTRNSAGGWSLAAGPGHYATLNGEDITLAGRLEVALHYDFHPRDGETFRIIQSSRRLTGQFAGLPEGALLGCTEDGIGLSISYARGAVQLQAKATPPATCAAIALPNLLAARR